MTIHEFYKRRIRVEGHYDALEGYQLKVFDVETGEAIPNIARIALTLDARNINRATVVYYEFDENEKLALKDGDPVRKIAMLDNPDVGVTAYERFSRYAEYGESIDVGRRLQDIRNF